MKSSWRHNHKWRITNLIFKTKLWLTSTYISVPTHILRNSLPCIYLIFTDHPNLTINSGVHLSLYTYCHHQIVYCRFNLFVEYPPPFEYEQLAWDFSKANCESIKSALEQVNCQYPSENKDVKQQVRILNNTLMSVFFKFCTNYKVTTIDDRDPPWITDMIMFKTP